MSVLGPIARVVSTVCAAFGLGWYLAHDNSFYVFAYAIATGLNVAMDILHLARLQS